MNGKPSISVSSIRARPVRLTALTSITVLFLCTVGLLLLLNPAAGESTEAGAAMPQAEGDLWILEKMIVTAGGNDFPLNPGTDQVSYVWDHFDMKVHFNLRFGYPQLLRAGTTYTITAAGEINILEPPSAYWRWSLDNYILTYPESFYLGSACSDLESDSFQSPEALDKNWRANVQCAFDPAFFDVGPGWDADEDTYEHDIAVGLAYWATAAGYYSDSIRIRLKYRRCNDPTSCLTIKGQVYTVPEQNMTYPLIGVPVTLLHNGQFLRQTVTQPPYGDYVFTNVPVSNNYTISTTLRHDGVFPSPFQVLYQQRGTPPVTVSTQAFATNANVDPLIKDIVLVDGLNNPPLIVPARINRNNLNDIATIYYHTYQAWELTDLTVGQPLDLKPPLDILSFSTQPSPNDGVYYVGPRTNGANAGVQPYINIETFNGTSLVSDPARPDNREWHEFGHHVMADTLGNMSPVFAFNGRNDSNHGGFGNPSTTDSWTEGFAEFYSMLVAKFIAGEQRPELYRISRHWEDNLEANSLAWRFIYSKKANQMQWLEELAVAGLLWDLVDPVNVNDSTILGGTAYGDCVDIPVGTFWDVLATNWDNPPLDVTLSPAAPPGYGYIFDIKQLYEVLKNQGVGASYSRQRALSDLDELFIAHGFFADLDNFGVYDEGEVIGSTGNPALNLPTGGVLPARAERRSLPTPPDTLIGYAAQDIDGGEVEADTFLIEVQFAPPHEHYNYSFVTTADAPGRLYFNAPDTHYQVTTHITPLVAGFVGEPLAVQNDFYFDQIATATGDTFIQHTFVMERQENLFLPFITGGSNAAALIAQATAQPQNIVSCLPDGVTPTPTPTPTSTPEPLAPLVLSINPNNARQGSTVNVTITGEGFHPGANPFIGSTPLQEVEQPDTQTLVGVLPAVLLPGVYDVVVVNQGGKTGSLPAGFTITAGVTPSATTTLTPSPTATATATPSPAPTPIYEDDFDDPGSGWPSSDTDNFTTGYVDGEYSILVKNPNWLIWSAISQKLTDLILEVDGRSANAVAGGYGLLFGVSDDGTRYYAFRVDNSGRYRLTKRENGAWQQLRDWTDHAAIQPYPATNHLHLIHQGSEISLFVNGTLLEVISGETAQLGRVGLLASAFGDPDAESRFDNFRAYSLTAILDVSNSDAGIEHDYGVDEESDRKFD